jgi:hypothetical protein
LQTIFLYWPGTNTLWSSASQAAKIVGISHWHLDQRQAGIIFFNILYPIFFWILARDYFIKQDKVGWSEEGIKGGIFSLPHTEYGRLVLFFMWLSRIWICLCLSLFFSFVAFQHAFNILWS